VAKEGNTPEVTESDPRQQQPLSIGAVVTMLLWTCFLLFWYAHYLTGQELPAVDLYGHIAVTERLANTFFHNPIFFYDHAWFSGWPAFQFYGFTAHLAACILSLFLNFFFADPARIAIYFLITCELATLHWSLFYAASPLYKENCPQSKTYQWLLALVLCALSFWFLNHDGSMFGIGASAIFHAGLYPQLLAWHLLFLFIGSLFRIVANENVRCAPVFLALLICTHTLTALYAVFFALFTLLRFSEKRGVLAKALTIGIGLSAFWLLPMLMLNSEYGVNNSESANVQFFTFLFRYPWLSLLSDLMHGHISGLSALELIFPILIIVLLGSKALRNSRLLNHAALSVLIAIIFFSSPFVSSSLPPSIHYYRMDAYSVLFAIVILSIVPFALFAGALNLQTKLLRIGILLGSLIVVLTTTLLPDRESRLMRQLAGQDLFSTQKEVLNYLNDHAQGGRVLFDYFKDYSKFHMLTPHYMTSRLFEQNAIETSNGVFIQSSVAYLFPAAVMIALGAEPFIGPIPFPEYTLTDNKADLAELKRLGITDIVTTDGPFLNAIQPFAVNEQKKFGPYVVLELGSNDSSLLTEVNRPIIGYTDYSKTLPFRHLEYYFFQHRELRDRFELIEIPAGAVPPRNLSLLIINGASREQNIRVPIAHIDFTKNMVIDHYNVSYSNSERDAYGETARYLDKQFDASLRNILIAIKDPDPSDAKATALKIHWSADGQHFELQGLQPGHMVRINYSYFPYWSTSDGTIYRAGEERMMFTPNGESAWFSYSSWSSASVLFGSLISILSLSALIFSSKRKVACAT
jgi:hypothetical protein